MSGPVDVTAILADLQQQVSDLTGVVEAQRATLRDLNLIVQSQDHALRQLLPDSPLRSAVPLPAPAAPTLPGGA